MQGSSFLLNRFTRIAALVIVGLFLLQGCQRSRYNDRSREPKERDKKVAPLAAGDRHDRNDRDDRNDRGEPKDPPKRTIRDAANSGGKQVDQQSSTSGGKQADQQSATSGGKKVILQSSVCYDPCLIHPAGQVVRQVSYQVQAPSRVVSPPPPPSTTTRPTPPSVPPPATPPPAPPRSLGAPRVLVPTPPELPKPLTPVAKPEAPPPPNPPASFKENNCAHRETWPRFNEQDLQELRRYSADPKVKSYYLIFLYNGQTQNQSIKDGVVSIYKGQEVFATCEGPDLRPWLVPGTDTIRTSNTRAPVDYLPLLGGDEFVFDTGQLRGWGEFDRDFKFICGCPGQTAQDAFGSHDYPIYLKGLKKTKSNKSIEPEISFVENIDIMSNLEHLILNP